jgi:hypothetical protein
MMEQPVGELNSYTFSYKQCGPMRGVVKCNTKNDREESTTSIIDNHLKFNVI